MRFITWCVLSFLLISCCVNAQTASYAEGGFMMMKMKKAGAFESANVPGFSLGVSGLEFTLYAGQFHTKEFPDSAALNLNGGLWNIGYIWRSKPTEKIKRFHYTAGFGLGGFGIGEQNGFQLNLRPGVQVNLTRSVSLAASCYAGYNIFGKDRQEGGLLYESDLYKSTKGFFLLPSVTLRLNTNPLAVMGEGFSRSTYWGGGMITNEHYDVGNNVKTTTRYYLPAGEYITDAIITSTNYINVFPKFIVGTRKNNKGPSMAAGGGFALRAGLLALDVEYLRGKIGFHGPDGIGSNQDYWKISRTSIGLGINFFNIPFPLKGPSLVRLILGSRLCFEKLESNRPDNPNLPAGTEQHPENLQGRAWAPFWGVEFGTLGISAEIINNKHTGFGSGLLLGATYLIPLTGRN